MRKLYWVIAFCAWSFSAGAGAQQAPAPETPASPEMRARADARERNLRAYVELLRTDVRLQKASIITQMMHFTAAEDAAFWPIYRDYEQELARLNDDRMAAIEEYARAYTQMTPAMADALANTALELEARRAALKQRYYARLKAAMSPLTAARLLQIENQIGLLLDLQIAASLPIVEEPAREGTR